jgi:hypothetical protein
LPPEDWPSGEAQPDEDLVMQESLWQRFKSEYLCQLVLTSKKKGHKLQLQEVVLLGVENTKRIDWPLAVVEELIPG